MIAKRFMLFVPLLCLAACFAHAQGGDSSASEEPPEGVEVKSGQSELMGEAIVLDVRQAVAMALARNGRALAAEADLEAARARIGQAKSARLPQIRSQAVYTYIEDAQKDMVDEDYVDDFKDDVVDSGLMTGAAFDDAVGDHLLDLNVNSDSEDFQLTTIFAIEQVLYAGGTIKAAIRASDYLAESQAWRRESVLDQLEYEAKQAFYDCLLAGALVKVARDSVDTFEKHLENTRYMIEVGMVSDFQLLRAETELAVRESQVVSARTGEQLAQMNLRRVIAADQDRPLELEGGLAWHPLEVSSETLVVRDALDGEENTDGNTDAFQDLGVVEAPLLAAGPAEPVAALLSEAHAKRAELHALDQAIEAAGQNLRARRGQFLPKAALSIQWQETTGAGRLIPNGWQVGLGADLEIYTGGRRKAEIRQVRAEIDSLEFQRDGVRRLIEFDVRQAYIRAREAIDKIGRDNKAVALAQEGSRLAEIRYREGVGTQVETMEAGLAVTQARTALARALRDYAVAQASLDKAVGRSWVPRDAPDDGA